MTEQKIRFPFGPADEQAIPDAATSLLTITNTFTILKRTGGLGQAVTGLSLLADQGLMKGSKVKVDIAQGATGRNVTFGSAGSTIVAPALTGAANDRDVIELTWTGSAFEADTVWQKIVDA